MNRSLRTLLLTACLGPVLALAGCGGKDEIAPGATLPSKTPDEIKAEMLKSQNHYPPEYQKKFEQMQKSMNQPPK